MHLRACVCLQAVLKAHQLMPASLCYFDTSQVKFLKCCVAESYKVKQVSMILLE